jgi:hypothetical protein
MCACALKATDFHREGSSFLGVQPAWGTIVIVVKQQRQQINAKQALFRKRKKGVRLPFSLVYLCGVVEV